MRGERPLLELPAGCSGVRSMISFAQPFFGKGLVIAIDDHEPDVAEVILKCAGHISLHIEIVCARVSELWQIALPNPFAVHTFTLPFWIRETGRLIYGEDVRNLVPLYPEPARLLRNYLEIVPHRVRNHVILSCLTDNDYPRLLTGLRRERDLAMLIALASRRVWRIYPNTLLDGFRNAYPDQDLKENETEYAECGERLSTCDEAGRSGAALRLVWLYEQFVKRLWNHCA